MVIRLKSATFNYIKGNVIDVEISITKGIPVFNIVGLPSTEVRESRERVRSAILNSGYKFPLGRITVNLAPANFKKEGSLLDLSIAIGILVASKQIKYDKKIMESLILGELSLDGYIKKINTVIPIIVDGKENGYKNFIIPKDNVNESKFIQGVNILSFTSLSNFIKYLNEGIVEKIDLESRSIHENSIDKVINFEDILGHISSKRALQISSAGFHNIILYGPVGSGKTMLAKSFKSILPKLDYRESLEKGRVYSLVNSIENLESPVFREAHHTISKNALLGLGRGTKVGEVTLSNNGVLFLDEMLEFKRDTLEVLRKVLEDKKIKLVRNDYMIEYPANFILLGATNLCPCGNYLNNSAIKQCVCETLKRERYINKISKSLLDRIDMFSYTPVIDYVDVTSKKDGRLTSKNALDKINTAREIQKERFKSHGIRFNSEMNNELVNKFCRLDNKSKELLESVYRKESISTRSYFKILKIARTIADLEGDNAIKDIHIMEVVNYRKFINNQVV